MLFNELNISLEKKKLKKLVHPDEALTLVLKSAPLRPTREIPISQAFGAILGRDVVSPNDLPAFNKSAMDGFAYISSDQSEKFRVIETIAAGQRPTKPLKIGECAKIMTGAMIPENADRVVPFELCLESEGMLKILKSDHGTNVCFQGENIAAGTRVLRKGEMIRVQEIATLASIGFDKIDVFERPRVTVVSTGSEIVLPGRSLNPAQTFDSNGPQLLAQLSGIGLCGNFAGIVPDCPEKLGKILKKSISSSDVVLVTGGVSQGDYDFVPEVLKENGVSLVFEKIALKPGRPTIFGMAGDKAVFGLPGNPVATFVIFEILVKPFLFAMMGHTYSSPTVTTRLANSFSRKKAGRVEMVPVFYDGEKAVFVPFNGPAHVNSLRTCNAFLRIEAGLSEVSPQTLVPLILF